jgi:hypothetical protein
MLKSLIRSTLNAVRKKNNLAESVSVIQHKAQSVRRWAETGTPKLTAIYRNLGPYNGVHFIIAQFCRLADNIRRNPPIHTGNPSESKTPKRYIIRRSIRRVCIDKRSVEIEDCDILYSHNLTSYIGDKVITQSFSSCFLFLSSLG